MMRRLMNSRAGVSGTIAFPMRFLHNKVVTAEDAVNMIRSGDTVTVGGFVTQNCAEEVLAALAHRYETTKEPKDLTVLFGGGPGDYKTRGINHFAHEGMVRRAIGSHYGQVPMLAKLALENKIQAYNFPMGATSRMIRAAASKQPGYITKVGFGTMTDPAIGGGKINAVTKEDLVEVIELFGEKYLCFRTVPVNVAIIRGTTADCFGNVTFERESLYADNLQMAMAARASRGTVILQVERLAELNSLNPRAVRIPGALVDAVVVAKPENHTMSFITNYNPAFSGEVRVPARLSPMEMDERKLIARRAVMEVVPRDVVNLGIGMPEGVALVAEEEKVIEYFELTTEPGVHGGVGASGHDFGPASNYHALLEMNQQFDFYNGGGLDVCFLGMAQITANGDVNVTRVGPKLTGPGGFIDISQSTRRVNLLGSFTASGLEVAVEDGKLKILKEGSIKKFVKSIPEITFSGAEAVRRRQRVKYITERAVFGLTPAGVELLEIAPGIDLQTQILDLMDFKPIISKQPIKIMNPAIFRAALMGLRDEFDHINMAKRMYYSAETKKLFVNLSMASIEKHEDVEAVRSAIVKFFEEDPKRIKNVEVIANYDHVELTRAVQGEYKTAMDALEATYYKSVRRLLDKAFRYELIEATKNVAPKAPMTCDDFISFAQSHGLTQIAPIEDLKYLFHEIDTTKSGVIAVPDMATLLQRLSSA